MSNALLKLSVDKNVCITQKFLEKDVVENVKVVRCFKCNGFGHVNKVCGAKVTCGFCGGEHHHTQCQSTRPKCVNCCKANVKYGLKLEVEHAAVNLQKCK
jgi:hypothetical protein